MRLIDADDLYRKVVGYNGGAVDKTVAKRLIEQQPTVQRNPTQSNAPNTLNALDTIYRQAAIDVVNGIDSGFVKYIEELPSAQPDLQEYSVWFRIGETLVDVSKMHITAEEGIEKIRSYLMRMKKPERKKGEWIDETFKPWGLVHHPYKCNQCGEHSEADSNFCPNCGADMRGEEDV